MNVSSCATHRLIVWTFSEVLKVKINVIFQVNVISCATYAKLIGCHTYVNCVNIQWSFKKLKINVIFQVIDIICATYAKLIGC